VGGALSALPIVSAGNLCCCLWVVSGGMVAAYLLQQNQSDPIDPGDGALVGLFAGIIGAFVYLVISIPVTILVAPIQRQLLDRLFQRLGNVPPNFRDYADFANSPLAGTMVMLISFVVWLFINMIFSPLGGLLSAILFRKKAAPPLPPTTDLPPSI
jgi:hypothetical protein